jgi:hypothetical protein
MQEELAEAKHVYEAMNEELYIELPALYSRLLPDDLAVIFLALVIIFTNISIQCRSTIQFIVLSSINLYHIKQ